LRDGISLSRQTMANWIINVAILWLSALYDLMQEQLLAHEI
jgi:hypothetical protein